MSSSFSRSSKVGTSRDAIASDSDTRNIQALSDFLRFREPPPSSFTSVPEDEDPRGPGIMNIFGRRSRRNSIMTMRSLRKTKSDNLRKPLHLPDTAVAMKTSKGGHWYIAITVPGENDTPPPVPPLPSVYRPSGSNIHQVREPSPPKTVAKKDTPFGSQFSAILSSPKSQRTLKKPRPDTRRQKPNVTHVRERPASPVSQTMTVKPARDSVHHALLTPETFESRKYKIAAAVAAWESGSSELDLHSYLLELAAMAPRGDSGYGSSQQSVSRTSIDHEMDLWHNRTMSIETQISPDFAATHTNADHYPADTSDETIKNSPALVPRRRDSIETIRTQRRERVSAIRKRDVMAAKAASIRQSHSAGEFERKQTQPNSAPVPHVLDSPVPLMRHSGLWQPPAILNSNQKPTLWQPIPLLPEPTPPPPESKSEPESDLITNEKEAEHQGSSHAKDAQILEITKCLAELQEQNAIMMRTLVAVTNMGSSYQDMASLTQKAEKRASLARSTLLEF
jgi:hypothetical protein